MARGLSEYLISQDGLDLHKALQSWDWLLPEPFTVWMITRVADMFLGYPDGSVHMLDTGRGTVDKVAVSREEFADLLDKEDNAEQWFAFNLVDRCIAAGLTLQSGECFGFVQPPVLGGQYAVENIRAIPVDKYVGAYGSIHKRIKDLPYGTEIILRPFP